MRRRLIRIALILLLFPPLLAAVAGWLAAPAFLHPIRRELTPDLIREADASFAAAGATREDFDVKAPDGAPLRGWKVRPKNPNGSWVLLFHGVADNRVGVIGQSEFLLRAGYSIVLQSAAADPRIEAVVAEAPFASVREATYDYAGLRKYPWLGKTLFAPGTWTLLYRDEKLAGFPVAEVSPVKAVASRAFPVLLICDEKDVALPCRHSEMIYAAARGPKQLWVVPGAFHTAAYGFEPQEFRRRVLSFFAAAAAKPAAKNGERQEGAACCALQTERRRGHDPGPVGTRLYSCPYKEMEGARGTRPHLEGTNYRALARDLGCSVESVDGQGG